MLPFISKDTLDSLFAELATPAGIAAIESQLNEPAILQAITASEFNWIMCSGAIRVLPLAQRIKAYFERPENLPPDEADQTAKLIDRLQLVMLFGALVAGVGKLPASVGYEPLLRKRGVSGIAARGLAHLSVRSGKRVANDSIRLAKTVESICFLAKQGRRKRAMLRHIDVLLAAWDETSVFDMIFDGSALNVFGYIEALKATRAGNEPALKRVVEISAALAPSLPKRRGRRVSAQSSAHEFLLENEFPDRSFTWNEYEKKFTDDAAEATRREFNLSHFDPRPAARRRGARRRLITSIPTRKLASG